MKVLITGICGFAGSRVARSLIELFPPGSIEIVGLDNFARPGSWTNRDPLTKLGITLSHCDIRAASDLEGLGPVDWVIDAAANPSVLAGVDGRSSSRQLMENNLVGTLNLLELCRRHGAGFILLSTSRVYSIPPLLNLPIEPRDGAFSLVEGAPLPSGISPRGVTEESSTAPPSSLYGTSKQCSEQLALEYGETFDFPVWLNRCGVLAGAGQFARPDQGIFAFWLLSWKNRRPMKYLGFEGSGHQVRDCLHPFDVAQLVKAQLEAPHHTAPRIVNVSGGLGSARSLRQLSDWCRDRWGDHTVIASTEERPFDLPWVVLDASRAEETWNWRPSLSTQQILEEIASFADEHPEWLDLSI